MKILASVSPQNDYAAGLFSTFAIPTGMPRMISLSERFQRVVDSCLTAGALIGGSVFLIKGILEKSDPYGDDEKAKLNIIRATALLAYATLRIAIYPQIKSYFSSYQVPPEEAASFFNFLVGGVMILGVPILIYKLRNRISLSTFTH